MYLSESQQSRTHRIQFLGLRSLIVLVTTEISAVSIPLQRGNFWCSWWLVSGNTCTWWCSSCSWWCTSGCWSVCGSAWCMRGSWSVCGSAWCINDTQTSMIISDECSNRLRNDPLVYYFEREMIGTISLVLPRAVAVLSGGVNHNQYVIVRVGMEGNVLLQL